MTKCKLPECDNEARIKFCSNKCKDKWHNRNNPRGYFAHLNPDNISDNEHYDNMTHPFSGEALGQD